MPENMTIQAAWSLLQADDRSELVDCPAIHVAAHPYAQKHTGYEG